MILWYDTWSISNKIKKLTSGVTINWKSPTYLKVTINKVKRQPIGCESILQTTYLTRSYYPKYVKKPCNSKVKSPNNPIFEMLKG